RPAARARGGRRELASRGARRFVSCARPLRMPAHQARRARAAHLPASCQAARRRLVRQRVLRLQAARALVQSRRHRRKRSKERGRAADVLSGRAFARRATPHAAHRASRGNRVRRAAARYAPGFGNLRAGALTQRPSARNTHLETARHLRGPDSVWADGLYRQRSSPRSPTAAFSTASASDAEIAPSPSVSQTSGSQLAAPIVARSVNNASFVAGRSARESTGWPHGTRAQSSAQYSPCVEAVSPSSQSSLPSMTPSPHAAHGTATGATVSWPKPLSPQQITVPSGLSPQA